MGLRTMGLGVSPLSGGPTMRTSVLAKDRTGSSAILELESMAPVDLAGFATRFAEATEHLLSA